VILETVFKKLAGIPRENIGGYRNPHFVWSCGCEAGRDWVEPCLEHSAAIELRKLVAEQYDGGWWTRDALTELVELARVLDMPVRGIANAGLGLGFEEVEAVDDYSAPEFVQITDDEVVVVYL
jgi:hypothetical protein